MFANIALRNLMVPVAAMMLGVGLIGCAEERHSAIPVDAQMVTSTQDRGSWTAPADGKVFVDSASRDKLLWSGEIKKGQSVTLNERKDRITVDGRTVTDVTLPGGAYRIFFQPAKESTVEKVTVERSHEVKVKTDVE